MNFLEIEVVKGQTFALTELSADKASKPACLHLSVPEDSKTYSLRDMLSVLSSKYTQLKTEILDPQTGLIKGDTVIIINGTNMDLIHGLDTSIDVGDHMTLVRFASGG